MSKARQPLALALALALSALLGGAARASALAGAPGGAQAPSAVTAGGSEYGASRGPARRPVLALLGVARRAAAGPPPPVLVRIDERGVGTVYVGLAVRALATGAIALRTRLGWVRTGRTLTARWPAGAQLAPGAYRVSVSARDHHGGTLVGSAHVSSSALLRIVGPTPAPAPAPAPPPAGEGVPTPAATAAAGAVFPVAGAHSFGGPEDRFGAPRGNHIHQGQDVLAAEGTPVVAPMAGSILTTAYQAGGAGYYAVERTGVGLDLMFAHCQAGSLLVSEGASVAPGQQLCRAGQTGDATAPHLHLEMWVGGWQTATGHPIDPLPYLEAWERVP